MKKKIIAIILASTITLGWLPASAYAYSSGSQTKIESREYKTGTYEVNNSILKTDSDTDSAARKYVDTKSTITVNKDNMTASLTFNNKNLMSNIVVKVNGNEIKYTSVEEGATNLIVTFSLDSINDSIEVSSLINTGFFKLNVSFRVLFDTSSLPIEEEAPEQDDDSSTENGGADEGDVEDDDNENNDMSNENGGVSDEQKPSTPQPPVQNPPAQDPLVQTPPQQPVEDPEVPETPEAPEEDKAPVVNKPTSDSSQNYSIYKIKNEILTSSAVGYSAARSAVNSYSYVEKIDSKTYVTLGISQLDVMSNIRVYVNGSKVNYEILRKSDANHTMDIRYSVNSLSDTVSITAHINMMAMDISFGLDLLEDTMTLISSTSASKPLAEKTESNVLLTTDNNSSSSESTSSSDSETSSETEELNVEAKSYFKKYTIENDIISDSTIGKNMARKYIDTTSILEDIDGQLYLTLVLSDSSAMSNIKIKVNNEEVKYSKTSSNGKVSYKFKISSITDEIRMSMTVTVVNKEVEFGIDLLESTMKLVEEKTIEQEEKESLTIEAVPNETDNNVTTAASPINIPKIILITIISTILVIGIIEAIIFAFIKKKKVK